MFLVSVRSFIELARILITENPKNFILSEKFSQDPLEQHFGKHRKKGGCSENPMLHAFKQQEVALGVINSDLISDFTGNTKGRPDNRPPISVDDSRLPVKRRK